MNKRNQALALGLSISIIGLTALTGCLEEFGFHKSPPLVRELVSPEYVESPLWDVIPEQSEYHEVLADGDDASYVYTTTPGLIDVIDLTEPSAAIMRNYPLSVRVWIRGIGLEGEIYKNRGMGIGIRVSDLDGSKDHFERIRLGSSIETYYAEWPKNPMTGDDWTWPDISDLKALIMSGKPGVIDGGGRVAKLVVEIVVGANPDTGLLMAGPIFGAVTSSQIKVWVKTRHPCSVQIRYGTDETDVKENNGDTQTTDPVVTTDDRDNTTTFTIADLTPDTKYFFTVLIDGYGTHEFEETNPYWYDLPYCRTFPPERTEFDFDFAFSGDMHQMALEHDLFAEMESKLEEGDLPHFFIDLGDYYWNESDDLTILRDGFNLRRGYHAEARHLNHHILRKMPSYALGSDHDGVGNNYCKLGVPKDQGGHVIQEFKRVPNVNKARLEYFPLPDFDGINNGFDTEVTGIASGGGKWFLDDPATDFLSLDIHPGMIVIHDPEGADEAYSFVDTITNTGITLSQHLVSMTTGYTGPTFEEGDRYEIWRSCLYYRVTVGDAEFFFLDTRSKRDPNNTEYGDMLDGRMYLGGYYNSLNDDRGSGTKPGHLQRDWLVNNINGSTKKWKFIISEIPFKHDEGTPPEYFEFQKHDKWGDYDPNDDQRTYLKDNITADNVIWLSADRHFCGLNDASQAEDPWPEALASPLCYLGPGIMPSPLGSWMLNSENGIFAGPDGLRAGFGIVRVRSDLVTIDLYNHDGSLINNGYQDLTMTVNSIASSP